MATVEDHDLLMEALMFFSSGEDQDENCSTTTTIDSDHESFALVNDTVPSHSANDPTFLDLTLQQVLLGLSEDPVQYGSPTHGKRSAPSEVISPAAKQLSRHKRVKKCTYAARRTEVSQLRASTVQLEAQLQHLRKRVRTRATFSQSDQELAQSQAENARLRALVEANAARIREAQASGLCWRSHD